MDADVLLGLCDRFHKLPSEVMAEDASLLQLLAIERRAYPERFEQS